MAAGIIAGLTGPAAIAAVEKLAPIVLADVQPALSKLWASLPAGMVAITPASPAVTAETAIAANLKKAVKGANAEYYSQIKSYIGNAIAIYVTEKGAQDLASGGQDQAAWVDIAARARAAIQADGIVVDDIEASTFNQMLMTGIEMYRAGQGTRALSV